MKSFIILIIFCSVLGSVGYLAYQAVKPNKEELRLEAINSVPTRTVSLANIEESIITSAAVRPILETEVRSEINGRIVSILIEEGDSVVKDQPLIELDRTNLETRVEEAQRQVDSEQLRLKQRERDFERLKALHEEDFANEASFLNAQTDLELAKLQLAIRKSRLVEAEEDLGRAGDLTTDGVVSPDSVATASLAASCASVAASFTASAASCAASCNCSAGVGSGWFR